MLAEAQRGFARLFEGGPAMVDPALFAGAPARIALGLAIHANTVATVRLAALLAGFPRLIERIGDDACAELAIEWLSRAPPGRKGLNEAGEEFPDFLAEKGAPAEAVVLARLDQAWLSAYHAADAPPLTINALASAEARLAPHPAARLVKALPPLDPPVPEWTRALLVARPEAKVTVLPLDRFEQALFEAAAPSATLSEMIEAALTADNRAPEPAFASARRLIGAGAFILIEGECS